MTDLKAAAEAAKAADADPNLGAFKDAYRHFQTLATPSAILALYAERDGAFLTSQQAAQSYSNLMRVKDDIDAQRQAAEASLASATKEVERLRKALERIRNLDEADGHDLTWQHASEAVGLAHQALTKETPHAER